MTSLGIGWENAAMEEMARNMKMESDKLASAFHRPNLNGRNPQSVLKSIGTGRSVGERVREDGDKKENKRRKKKSQTKSSQRGKEY